MVTIDGPNGRVSATQIVATTITNPAGTTTITLNSDGSSSLSSNVGIDVTDNLVLAQTTVTTVPAAGFTTMWGKGLAKRGLVACMGMSGMDYTLQPSMWRQKASLWTPPGNATTVPGVFAITAPTAVGTATARTVAVSNVATRMRRLGYVSAATAGSLGGHYIANAQFTVGSGGTTDDSGFFYSCRFVISDAAAVAGARMFVGMSSTVAAPTNVEPTTLLNSVGVAQLSTDNTQLYIVYGGSAAQAAIPLGTNFPPTTGSVIAYDLTLFSPPNLNGVINYRLERLDVAGIVVEGTLTPGTVGVQTPASTTLLTHRAWRCNNATALAVGIDVCSVYLETDM